MIRIFVNNIAFYIKKDISIFALDLLGLWDYIRVARMFLRSVKPAVLLLLLSFVRKYLHRTHPVDV